MVSVFTTINAPMKYSLRESTLVELLKKCEFPTKYDQHIYSFFTEVSPSVVCRFCNQNGISMEILKSYYFKYIQPLYTNRNLEEIFNVD
ncbi:MAG: hypothetical protein AB1422_17355 [bacterium]